MKAQSDNLKSLLAHVLNVGKPQAAYRYPIQPVDLPPGVVPAGRRGKALAMDNAMMYAANAYSNYGGFAGYPYLAQLMTRAEYRSFASGMSSELTREWVEFTSTGDKAEKIKKIEEEFKRLKVRDIFMTAAEQDCAFGRAQIYFDIAGADPKVPLILDPKTVRKD